MILAIDTSDMKKVKVSLKDGDKVVKSLSAKNKYGSQVLLPLISKLLRTMNYEQHTAISWQKTLKAIEVAKGPGSFTGIRVGVSVANALGYSLGIPVNQKKLETDLIY